MYVVKKSFIVASLLGCLLASTLVLSGCGKSSGSGGDNPSPPPPPPPAPTTPGQPVIDSPANGAKVNTNTIAMHWNIASGAAGTYWYFIVDNNPAVKTAQFDKTPIPAGSVQSGGTTLNSLSDGYHSVIVKVCNTDSAGSSEVCSTSNVVSVTVSTQTTQPVWVSGGNLPPDATANTPANGYQTSSSVKTYLTSASQQMTLTFHKSGGDSWLNVDANSGYVYDAQMVPNNPGATAQISVIATNTATNENSDPQTFTVKIANPAKQGVIMGYYSNWTVYNSKLRHGAAKETSGEIPPYGLSGISWQQQAYGAQHVMVKNADADAQVKLLDIIMYAFAEVYPSYSVQFDAANNKWIPFAGHTINAGDLGKVYLSDPWSDLFPKESGASQLCDTGKISQDPYLHQLCLGGYETVINGATGQPTKSGTSVLSQYLASPGDYFFSGNLNQFSKLNTLNPNIKRMLSIGGWYHEDSFEAGAFVNPDNFINSLKVVMDYFKLDGVDLDYEPGYYNPTYTAENADKFTSLIKKVRSSFDQTESTHKLITIAISANTETIKVMDGTNGGNWTQIANAVDYISVMGYDFHGAFDKQGDPNKAITDFQSNLVADPAYTGDYPEGKFNTDAAVSMLINTYHVPPSKILLGVPSYARAVQGVNNANNGLYQAYTNNAFLGDMDGVDDTRHPPQGQQSYYGLMKDESDTADGYRTIPAWINNGFNSFALSNSSEVSGEYAAWMFGSNDLVDHYAFASYDTKNVVKTKAQYVLYRTSPQSELFAH